MMIVRANLQALLILTVSCVPNFCAAVEDKSRIDFSHSIVPVLKKHCAECHTGKEAKGSFSMNTRELIADSGMIDVEDPDESHLLELVTSRDPDQQMPPSGKDRLTAKEIDLLRNWIREGLTWDSGFTFGESLYEPPLLPRTPSLPPASDGRSNPIDRILDNYCELKQIPRPEPIDDGTFLRRVYLDLIGLLPTPSELKSFRSDRSSDKRTRIVDELLARKIDYADHWLSFFNDLLRNDYSGTGFITGGRRQVSGWLYKSLVDNKPFDQFARELISPPTAESRGYIDGIKWRGEVSAGQTIPIQFAQSVAQSFLGINLKCASCHDSFVDRWKLKEAYGLAAIYSTEPMELHRCDKPTGETAEAAWLFPELGQIDAAAERDARLEQLAGLMTHPKNGRFTRTIVNRLWHRLMGRGIVHPLDAMQQPPWNADLLDMLASHLSEVKFDLKQTLRLIATSAAYQSRSEVVEEESESGQYVYRGPRSRRMSAEQLLDAVAQITDAAPTTMHAPVFRSDVDPELAKSLVFRGNWIWGDLTGGVAPPQEILVRKTFNLDSVPASAGAVVSCDNSFTMYVNNKEIAKGDDWTNFQSVAFHSALRKGSNSLVIVAGNGGDSKNPAGLFFEAHIELTEGDQVTIASDDTWKWHPNAKAFRRPPKDGWKRVSLPAELSVWKAAKESTGRLALSAVVAGTAGDNMLRVSLVKNTALMKSLGRPGREQIVSMRPTSLTTLEAIDLSNAPDFTSMLRRGAENLCGQERRSTNELVRHLFHFALSRDCTTAEQALFAEALGDNPTPENVEDLLWAIVLQPEFMLIR